ncbi:MAG TPA: hypothetical protein VFQ76_06390, partial [Longimicrobiaceae bacterium]|nr:hypothetical protein [Longimicrobiaceae bacterium]
ATRSDVGGTPHYHLTGTGHGTLRAIEEPAWVQAAAAIVRAALRERLLRTREPDPADLADEAAQVSGVPAPQVRRILEVLLRALRPQAVSPLAHALTSTGPRPVVFSSGLCDHETCMPDLALEPADDAETGAYGIYRLQSRSEWMVMCALERAGLPVREVLGYCPAGGDLAGDKSDPCRLSLDQPVISLSCRNPVSPALLKAHGDPVQLDGNSAAVWFEDDGLRTLSLEDSALVVRLYHPGTGASQFVLAGGTPEATYACSRYFYENIESRLALHPRRSFACVLSVSGPPGAPREPVEREFGTLRTHGAPRPWADVQEFIADTRFAGDQDRRVKLPGRRSTDLAVAGV